MLIPWAIPTVVSAQMWGWMYHDLYGVINEIFLGVGLIDRPHGLDRRPALSMYAVIAVDVWKTTPFMTLLILAALQMLPGEVYEAAQGGRDQPGQSLLQGDAAADQAGADGGDHLPHAGCAADLRPDVCADGELAGDRVDVGLCPPATGRFPGCRLRLRRFDIPVPDHRRLHRRSTSRSAR